MDQAAVVQAQGGGLFGQMMTLQIEERAFDFKARGGQDYKFFLVVRTFFTGCCRYVVPREDPGMPVIVRECVQ